MKLTHFGYLFTCSGFESETDTEEFEKLGQSPIDRQSSNDGKIIIESKAEMSTVGTSTDPIELTDSETLTEVCHFFGFHSANTSNNESKYSFCL